MIGVEKETDEGKEVECCKRTEEKEKDSVRQKLIKKKIYKKYKKISCSRLTLEKVTFSQLRLSSCSIHYVLLIANY